MIETIQPQLTDIINDVLSQTATQPGDLFILGLSSSEVVGGRIGKSSSQEVGEVIVSTLIDVLRSRDLNLAVQGCEHINRALVVERNYANSQQLDVVSVVPALHAGGSGATAAYKFMTDPVVVEHATGTVGIDIGDTSIGMHIKHVQVPIRPSLNALGEAHVTALGYRPKLIGGVRAVYE